MESNLWERKVSERFDRWLTLCRGVTKESSMLGDQNNVLQIRIVNETWIRFKEQRQCPHDRRPALLIIVALNVRTRRDSKTKGCEAMCVP